MSIEELIEREEGFEKAQRSVKRTTSPILATLYPREEGSIFENRFLMVSFFPGRFEIFKGILPPDLEVLDLGIKVHFVSVEDEDSGEIVNKMVLCPEETNEKFRRVYGAIGEFKGKCPLCEYAQEWWDRYNERRAQKGIKGLPAEEYRIAVQQDAMLQRYRSQARKFSAISRYMFAVFDLSKYEGKKPLDVEEYCEYQILFVPETVFSGIAGFVRSFVRSGIRFWDINSLHVVSIIRDTREGFPKVKYSVAVEPRPYVPSKELREYLEAKEIPDPSPLINSWTEVFVRKVIEREEDRLVAESREEGQRVSVEVQKRDEEVKQEVAQVQPGRLPPRGVTPRVESDVSVSKADVEPSQVRVESTHVSAEEVVKSVEDRVTEESLGSPIRRRLRFTKDK
jgi:hypothetical protein